MISEAIELAFPSAAERCFFTLHSSFFTLHLKNKNSDFSIRHFLNLVHRAFIINALDSFIDDAMPHSKNGLVRISYLEPGKEILGS